VTPPPESSVELLKAARDRVSYLVWALERHRLPERARNEGWLRVEEDYIRQLEAARSELQRLEAPP
jgi:hypothetical protein